MSLGRRSTSWMKLRSGCRWVWGSKDPGRGIRKGVGHLAGAFSLGVLRDQNFLNRSIDNVLLMEDHHLQLGHLLNGIFRAFLAHAALLQAAIRHQVGAPLGAPIDVDITRLHLLGEF